MNARKGWWEPLIYSQLDRSTGNNHGVRLPSEMGYGEGSLTVLNPEPVESDAISGVRIE